MNPATETPADLLARCGRSFHLAARFLPVAARDRAVRLYAFCRLLDDLADDGITTSTEGDPAQLLTALADTLATSPLPVAALYRSVGLRHDAAAQALIRALAADTHAVHLQTEAELLRYGYGVAGTVGLMMAEIMGADAADAQAHAIDLGIAMQLVNISRDVCEDAHRGRIYLPAAWLPAKTSAADLVRDPAAAWPAVLQALELAEAYFESGFRGLRYLPASCRRAIWIAGRVYREIGQELRRRGPTGLASRTVVPRWRKAWITTGCLLRRESQCAWYGRELHRAELHLALQGCWGAHQTA